MSLVAGTAGSKQRAQKSPRQKGSGSGRTSERRVIECPTGEGRTVGKLRFSARQGGQYGHKNVGQYVGDGEAHVAHLAVFDGKPLVVQVNFAAFFVGDGRTGMPLVGMMVMQ